MKVERVSDELTADKVSPHQGGLAHRNEWAGDQTDAIPMAMPGLRGRSAGFQPAYRRRKSRLSRTCGTSYRIWDIGGVCGG